MKNTSVIIIVAVVVVVLIAGGFLINKAFKKEPRSIDLGKTGGESGAAPVDTFKGNTYYIDITAGGLAAARFEIFKGDRVMWRNKDIKPHWIASNPHPTHDWYPESGGCTGSTFDSCGAILPGENWSFIFTKEGNWGYHDDKNLQNAGEIVVKVKQNIASS